MEHKDPIYEEFLAALNHQDKTEWRRKRNTLAKKAGISGGNLSRILSRHHSAKYETRAALASACGYTYEEFLALGRSLISADGRPRPDPSADARAGPDTADVVVFNGNSDHHHIVEQFKNKKAACELNAALVEIEQLDPVAFGRIIGHVEAMLAELKRQPGNSGRGPEKAAAAGTRKPRK